MKPKTMILMVVAVVCGLGASYMTSRVIAERNQAADAGEQEKVTVLVAKQKVPMGTLIKDPQKYFVEKAYTKGEEPKKALKSWDQLKDKRLNKPLSEDQFVTADELLDPKMQGIEGILPPGMRAVSIKVNVASIVAGFVLPNSRVDIIQTLRSGEHSITQTIMQNMVVLATDGIKDRPDDKGNMPASTVTLAAKPEDVQKLRLAEAIGELSLSLRGGEDEEISKLKLTRPQDLAKSGNKDGGPNADDPGTEGGGGSKLGGVPDVPAVPTPAVAKQEEQPPPAPPKTVTQIIYNGESVTKTVFVLKEGEVTTQVERTGLEPAPKAEKPQPEPEPKAKGDKAPADAPAKKEASPAVTPGAAK